MYLFYFSKIIIIDFKKKFFLIIVVVLQNTYLRFKKISYKLILNEDNL